MVELQPWHTVDIHVHHVCSNCPIGREIPSQYRIPGHGAKPRCPKCVELLSFGICER